MPNPYHVAEVSLDESWHRQFTQMPFGASFTAKDLISPSRQFYCRPSALKKVNETEKIHCR